MPLSPTAKLQAAIELFTSRDDNAVDSKELNALLQLSAKKGGGLLKSSIPELVKLHNLGESVFDDPKTRHGLFVALTAAGVQPRDLGVSTGSSYSPALADFMQKGDSNKMKQLFPTLGDDTMLMFDEYHALKSADGFEPMELSRHELVSSQPTQALRMKASEATKKITEHGELGPWDIKPSISQLVKNAEVWGYVVEYDMSGGGYPAADSIVYDRELNKIGSFGYSD